MNVSPMKIEFLCDKSDWGVIAPPIPAKADIPEWLRTLPAATKLGLTVKRCVPFMEAMTAGWLLPIGVTLRLSIKDGGRSLHADTERGDRIMLSLHDVRQVAGCPQSPRQPFRLHNFWTIKTPPGWSCLFVSPLNRANHVIEIVSGIVDTDVYHAPINFPFFPIPVDGEYVLEQGTPIVHVIPFERGTLEAEIRAETDDEASRRWNILAASAISNWYGMARTNRSRSGTHNDPPRPCELMAPSGE
jgi:Family of unknown function (DUF6065)